MELAPRIEQQNVTRTVLQRRVERFTTEAARANDFALRAEKQELAAEAAKELAKTPALVSPQIIADDVTPEALAELMQANSGTIAVMSAEGAGPFAVMAGRYDKNGAPNYEIYLKGHAGDMVKVNRRTSSPIVITNPALTMALTLQPDVLKALANVPGARGRRLTDRPRDDRAHQDRGEKTRHRARATWRARTIGT